MQDSCMKSSITTEERKLILTIMQFSNPSNLAEEIDNIVWNF